MTDWEPPHPALLAGVTFVLGAAWLVLRSSMRAEYIISAAVTWLVLMGFYVWWWNGRYPSPR